jgi:myosin heavy subunit
MCSIPRVQESADSLFSVLSAVLWLGNLRYRGERDDDCLNDSAALADSDAAIFRTIAALLNVDYAQLVQV